MHSIELIKSPIKENILYFKEVPLDQDAVYKMLNNSGTPEWTGYLVVHNGQLFQFTFNTATKQESMKYITPDKIVWFCNVVKTDDQISVRFFNKR